MLHRLSLPFGVFLVTFASLISLFAGFWDWSPVYSMPQALSTPTRVPRNRTRQLNLDDTLTVTRNGCDLELLSRNLQKAVIGCKPAVAAPLAADTSKSIVLQPNDRLKVLANGCALGMTTLAHYKIDIHCYFMPPPPTPAPTVTPNPFTDAHAAAIEAGAAHTCALTYSDRVRCWGANAAGQLGTGDFQDALTPGFVQGLPHNDATGLPIHIRLLRTGGAHTCVMTANRDVWCWGKNDYGQLGDGTTQNRNLPVRVKNLSHVIGLTAGASHTCARTRTGVKCWGKNDKGQLGDGTTETRTKPVRVVGLKNVAGLAGGADHSCALLYTGHAKCWGSNRYGQLGDGTTENRLTPVKVHGIFNLVALEAGAFHTCALTSDLYAKCWGLNKDGQLGNGTAKNAKRPSDLCADAACSSVLVGAARISLGHAHTCLTLTNQTVKCWGQNAGGQLGTGNTNAANTPRNVCADGACTDPLSFIQPLSNIPSVSAGGEHTCVITLHGSLKCWGSNAHGALGDGTTKERTVPVEVLGF